MRTAEEIEAAIEEALAALDATIGGAWDFIPAADDGCDAPSAADIDALLRAIGE